jgi:hypothetical protein
VKKFETAALWFLITLDRDDETSGWARENENALFL